MNQLTPVKLPEEPTRSRFSRAEFMQMIDSGAFTGMKVELVHGALERMSPARVRHAALQSELLYRLKAILADRTDLLVLADAGVNLGQDTLLGGDVVVARVIQGNRMLEADEVVLIAEVSATTLGRDLGFKREEYARAGIPNYWVVDVERRVIHRFAEPNAGDYLALASLRFGEAVPVPGTDDATITLD